MFDRSAQSQSVLENTGVELPVSGMMDGHIKWPPHRHKCDESESGWWNSRDHFIHSAIRSCYKVRNVVNAMLRILELNYYCQSYSYLLLPVDCILSIFYSFLWHNPHASEPIGSWKWMSSFLMCSSTRNPSALSWRHISLSCLAMVAGKSASPVVLHPRATCDVLSKLFNFHFCPSPMNTMVLYVWLLRVI